MLKNEWASSCHKFAIKFRLLHFSTYESQEHFFPLAATPNSMAFFLFNAIMFLCIFASISSGFIVLMMMMMMQSWSRYLFVRQPEQHQAVNNGPNGIQVLKVRINRCEQATGRTKNSIFVWIRFSFSLHRLSFTRTVIVFGWRWYILFAYTPHRIA